MVWGWCGEGAVMVRRLNDGSLQLWPIRTIGAKADRWGRRGGMETRIDGSMRYQVVTVD